MLLFEFVAEIVDDCSFGVLADVADGDFHLVEQRGLVSSSDICYIAMLTKMAF